ncbi:MAG: FMN-binding protein [Bacteroidales bacterium]|nr:FMN-binding protein [Bacteroidales bacterium]
MKTLRILSCVAALTLGFFAVMFAVENMGKKMVESLALEEIYTQPLCSGIIGYNDIVPLKITMTDGKISDIEILDNRETPRYMKRVVEGGLVEKFHGLTPSEAVDFDVDAVSGATFTSNAIIKSVRATMEDYAESHNPGIWGWQLLGVILSAAMIVACSTAMAKMRKNTK